MTELIKKWMDCKFPWSSNFIEVLQQFLQNGTNPSQRVFVKSHDGITDRRSDTPTTASHFFALHVCDIITRNPKELTTELLQLLRVMVDMSTLPYSDTKNHNLLHAMVIGISSLYGKQFEHSETTKKLTEILSAYSRRNPELCNKTDIEWNTPLSLFLQKCLSTKHLWITTQAAEQVFVSMTEIVKHLAEFTDLNLQNEDGSTAIHILFGKLDFSSSIKQENIENVSQLVNYLLTKDNVNSKDKYELTPYSWVIFWRENVNGGPWVAEVIIDNIQNIFERRRPDRYLAGKGTAKIRGRVIADIISEMKWTFDSLTVTSKKIKKMKEAGNNECLTHASLMDKMELLLKSHLQLLDKKLCNLSRKILELLIEDSNAQKMYDLMSKFRDPNLKENNFELFHLRSLCLNKGAAPSYEHIEEVELLLLECKSNETLLATVKMAGELIKAFKRPRNRENIPCLLNPILNQYHVSEPLRGAVTNVVLSSFETIEQCAESLSLINLLVYISSMQGNYDYSAYFKHMVQIVDYWRSRSPEVEEQFKNDEKYVMKKLAESSRNWLDRGLLHFIAIYCHNRTVLESVPKDIIRDEIHRRDIHGCTPLHIAYLHDNHAAISFLIHRGSNINETDKFEQQPHTLERHAQMLGPNFSNTDYHLICFEILKGQPGVFHQLNKLLLMPHGESKAISEQLEQLFKALGNTRNIQCCGSVREKLKVGQFDEVDLQIYFADGSDLSKEGERKKLRCKLVEDMLHVAQSGIFVRAVSLMNPWKFLWHGRSGNEIPRVISVDVVPMQVGILTPNMHGERQLMLLQGGQGHEPHSILKWKDHAMTPDVLKPTACKYEWDILDSLTTNHRLGILFTKALFLAFEEEEKRSGNQAYMYLKMPVTSYVIKNTLFWILSGELLDDLQLSIRNEHLRLEFDEDITATLTRRKLSQPLRRISRPPTWISEEEIHSHAGEGRLWAIAIIEVIKAMAAQGKIPGSYLDRIIDDINDVNVTHVVDTCTTLLECLSYETFFYREDGYLAH